MKVEQAYRLLAKIYERLPARYHRPRLVLHESAEALAEYVAGSRERFHVSYDFPASRLQGIADPNPVNPAASRIHVHWAHVELEADDQVLDTLLHEVCHIDDALRFGVGSAQHANEKRADAFAKRWARKLIAEKVV